MKERNSNDAKEHVKKHRLISTTQKKHTQNKISAAANNNQKPPKGNM